jgi:hypothetical protein
MTKLQSAYDLFGPTSLLNLERSIAEGRIPTAAELAAVLEANSEDPLPQWFLALVVTGLRGELKKKRGRPKESILSEISFVLAKAKYRRYLAEVNHVTVRAKWKYAFPLFRKGLWNGPPHERAARIVTARWLRHLSWRAFLNRRSS